MEKIRLGIIGVGNMGMQVSQFVALKKECPEITLNAICDYKEERRQWAAKTFEGLDIPLFADAEEMMKSGLIDAVYIATPHYDHPVLAMKAFGYGLHVMLEKPAGVYTKAVREMNEAAEKAGVVFAMMFQTRTSKAFQKVKQLLESGQYGQIRSVNWLITNWYRTQGYYDSGSWRATWAGEGGGVLLNQCPHQLDLWQWICGMPVKVQSKIKYGKWHDIEVDDDVTTFVEYENGATGVFITTTGDGKGTNRFEVQMDGAKLVVEDDKLTVTEFEMKESEFTKTNTEVFGMVKTHNLEIEIESKNPQHIGVVNAWAGKILHGTPLIAEGAEGLKGVILSNAMHLSDFLGREVEIPFDEDLYYEELMKRVATSKKKENVTATFADTNGTYGSAKV